MLDLEDSIEDNIRQKAILHIAEKNFSACFSLLFLYVANSFLFYDQIFQKYGLSFYYFSLVYVGVLALRFYSARYIVKNEAKIKNSFSILIYPIWLSSLVWGIGSLKVVLDFPQSLVSMVAMMCCSGLASAAVVSMSSSKLAMRVHILVMLLPLVIFGTIVQGTYGTTVGIVSFGYTIYLLMLTSIVEEQVLTSFKNEVALIHQSKELLDSRNLAIENLSRKADFVALLSHEIRTPLNGIIGSIELLKSENLSEEGKENLNALNISSQSLLELVNDILDSSKLQAGKLELRMSPVNIVKIAEDVFNLYKNLALTNHLKFIIQIHPDLKTKMVMIDELKVKQVLSNLVSNGIKYTNKGYVKIVVYKLGETDTKMMIKFSIEDSGAGLSPSEIDQLFKPYEQIERHSSKLKGSGLGLYLSNEICKKMGSKIHVESVPGMCTIFSFNLELVKCLSVESKVDKYPEEVKLKSQGIKVLLIDDNEINLQLLKKVLLKHNIESVCKINTDEAVEVFEHEIFDLVFLDINMPGEDGYQVFNRLQKINPNLVPIIACSAFSEDEDALKFLSYGFNDVLKKPVMALELRKILMKYLLQVKKVNS